MSSTMFQKTTFSKPILFITIIICTLSGGICDKESGKRENAILIVGAGTAGIAAASRLYENGYQNIKILEGEDRIGGFIDTKKILYNNDDEFIEYGDSWLVGNVDDTNLYNLTNRRDPLITPALDIGIILSNGTKLPENNNERLAMLLGEIFLELQQNALSRDNLENSQTIDQFIKLRFQEIRKSDRKYDFISDDLVEPSLRFFENYIYFMFSIGNWSESYNVDFVKLLNTRDQSVYRFTSGGMDTLHKLLLKTDDPRRSDKVEFHLKSVVTNINSEGDKTIVTTSKGETFMADHVIVSTPIGFLKKNFKTLFTPPLLDAKTKSIENVRIEFVEKLVIAYESPFWKDSSASIILAWTDEDYNQLDNDKIWLRSLFGFFFPRADLPYMYVIFHGPYAKYLTKIDDANLNSAINQIIQKSLGKIFTLSKQEKITRVKWNDNDNFLGRYSYVGLDAVSSDNLARPILNSKGKAIVHFAGDATSEHWYGNVEGELESGFRVADEINRT